MTDGHSALPADTAGPDAELPEGVFWHTNNDQSLGAALAVGPGAMPVISRPSRGDEHWSDTEVPQFYSLDGTTEISGETPLQSPKAAGRWFIRIPVDSSVVTEG